jgi:hypothetical protein
MRRRRPRDVESLWYLSQMTIGVFCAVVFGVWSLGELGFIQRELAGTMLMVIGLGGSLPLLILCAVHFLLAAIILVRGPMLLRKRMMLWYICPVVLCGLSQSSVNVYTSGLLACIALIAMIAWPVRWLSTMDMPST